MLDDQGLVHMTKQVTHIMEGTLELVDFNQVVNLSANDHPIPLRQEG